MVATRNTSIEPIVEPHVQNWVNNQIDAQLTRFREEVTVTIHNAIVVALSGPAGDVMRRNDEGTSRGTQPQFTRMTKIEFPKFGREMMSEDGCTNVNNSLKLTMSQILI
nr:hypothetical protein [Tanacetum cinerariifolium]